MALNIGEAGANGSGETKSGSGNPAIDFMSQIPPNWDKAKLHGEANLVVDSTKT